MSSELSGGSADRPAWGDRGGWSPEDDPGPDVTPVPAWADHRAPGITRAEAYAAVGQADQTPNAFLREGADDRGNGAEGDRPQASSNQDDADPETDHRSQPGETVAEATPDARADDQHLAAMEQLKADLKAELKEELRAELQADHKAEIDSIRAENQARLDAIEARHQAEIDDLKARIEAAQQDKPAMHGQPPDTGEKPGPAGTPDAAQPADRRDAPVPDDGTDQASAVPGPDDETDDPLAPGERPRLEGDEEEGSYGPVSWRTLPSDTPAGKDQALVEDGDPFRVARDNVLGIDPRPSGEELLEPEGHQSRADAFRRKSYEAETLEDVRDIIHEDVDLLDRFFDRPPTSSRADAPVHHPVYQPAQAEHADTNGVVMASLVTAILVAEGGRAAVHGVHNLKDKAHEMIERHRHAGG